jgi:hypothetical protein
VPLGNNRYQLKSIRNLNCKGIYKMLGDRLVMETPDDPRLTAYQWQRVNSDSYKLVEQPPVAKTGGELPRCDFGAERY